MCICLHVHMYVQYLHEVICRTGIRVSEVMVFDIDDLISMLKVAIQIRYINYKKMSNIEISYVSNYGTLPLESLSPSDIFEVGIIRQTFDSRNVQSIYNITDYLLHLISYGNLCQLGKYT